MRKITFYPCNNYKESRGKERITIQFRVYDEFGSYTVPPDNGTGNFTIHLKNMGIGQAKEIVINALMNSRYITNNFELEE
jgi:hypothetical protein